MTEIEKLQAENALMLSLLERWVEQYGYRETNVVKQVVVHGNRYGSSKVFNELCGMEEVNKERTKTV